MFALGINFEKMGAITTIGLAIAALYAIYMGRITQKKNKKRLLRGASILLSLAWVIKYFVKDTFGAFLAHNFYRIAKTSASVPFTTTIYEKASLKKEEADEFLIYREIVLNLSKLFFLLFLAGIFHFFPKPQIGFIFAAIASLGLIFVAQNKLPSFKFLKK